LVVKRYQGFLLFQANKFKHIASDVLTLFDIVPLATVFPVLREERQLSQSGFFPDLVRLAFFFRSWQSKTCIGMSHQRIDGFWPV
jgi:hypothetical protein